MANPKLSIPAAVEPVSLEDAKDHMRVRHTKQDTLIQRQIRLAREYAQAISHKQLIHATYILYLDSFPTIIRPPLPPLSSVTTLEYYDTANALQSLTEGTHFYKDAATEPARIKPLETLSWPSTYTKMNAVELTYVTGYGAAGSDVPEHYIQAMMLLLANWYEVREPIIVGMVGKEVALSVNALLLQDPVWMF